MRLEKFIDLFDNVNNTLREKLGDDVEIDWRDDSEVEIHNVKNNIDLEDLI